MHLLHEPRIGQVELIEALVDRPAALKQERADRAVAKDRACSKPFNKRMGHRSNRRLDR
jgi:hypothetical protein